MFRFWMLKNSRKSLPTMRKQNRKYKLWKRKTIKWFNQKLCPKQKQRKYKRVYHHKNKNSIGQKDQFQVFSLFTKLKEKGLLKKTIFLWVQIPSNLLLRYGRAWVQVLSKNTRKFLSNREQSIVSRLNR